MTFTASRTSRQQWRRRSKRRAHSSASTSTDTPPGQTQLRPKRFPQTSAVRLRKSPRMRPFQAEVGRKPVSPAMAPRSPVWLASRSSSSPRRRRRLARSGTVTPASRSSRVAWAVACPMLVSPATHSIRRAWTGCGPPSRRRSTSRCWKPRLISRCMTFSPVALEAEMPRLDDPGMHRAHGHLVHFFAVHAVMGELGRAGPLAGRGGQAAVRHEAHGFEPGMPFRADVPLFPELAFKKVRLRTVGRQGRVLRQGRGAHRPQETIPAVGDERAKPGPAVFRQTEERQQPSAVAYLFQHFPSQFLHGQDGHVGQGNGLLVVKDHDSSLL